MSQQHRSSIFVFIGPPGAGKGSLSRLLVKDLGWRQLSTGDLCRHHIANQTEIGKQIDFAIKSGKLVDDALIVEMVNQWLSEHKDIQEKVIFDGYPRTYTQAQAFDSLLQHDDFATFDVEVVRLSIPDRELKKRLMSRLICSNKKCQAIYSSLPNSSHAPQQSMQCDVCESSLIRRSDDEEAAIDHRLETYHEHANTLVSFFERAGYDVQHVDVNKPLNDIFVEFKSRVSE